MEEDDEEAHARRNQILMRQMNWLKRKSEDWAQQQGLRPGTRSRVATQWWIRAKDNVVQTSTDLEGLEYFRPKEELEQWKPENWRTWPYLSLTQDAGPDGHCGTYALAFKEELRLNIGWIFDFSHGCRCDVENC